MSTSYHDLFALWTGECKTCAGLGWLLDEVGYPDQECVDCGTTGRHLPDPNHVVSDPVATENEYHYGEVIDHDCPF